MSFLLLDMILQLVQCFWLAWWDWNTFPLSDKLTVTLVPIDSSASFFIKNILLIQNNQHVESEQAIAEICVGNIYFKF